HHHGRGAARGGHCRNRDKRAARKAPSRPARASPKAGNRTAPVAGTAQFVCQGAHRGAGRAGGGAGALPHLVDEGHGLGGLAELGGGLGLHQQDVGVAHLADILGARLHGGGGHDGHFAVQVAGGVFGGVVHLVGDAQHHVASLNNGHFLARVVGFKLVHQVLRGVVEAVAKRLAVILENVVGRANRDGAVGVIIGVLVAVVGAELVHDNAGQVAIGGAFGGAAYVGAGVGTFFGQQRGGRFQVLLNEGVGGRNAGAG
nr:hypothetical protein [Tanacetum cinerariifolium]